MREIDSGIDGQYIAIGHLFFESPDAMGAALGSAGEATADIPNLTSAEAAFHSSESSPEQSIGLGHRDAP